MTHRVRGENVFWLNTGLCPSHDSQGEGRKRFLVVGNLRVNVQVLSDTQIAPLARGQVVCSCSVDLPVLQLVWCKKASTKHIPCCLPVVVVVKRWIFPKNYWLVTTTNETEGDRFRFCSSALLCRLFVCFLCLFLAALICEK
jgi:hypothetical protein